MAHSFRLPFAVCSKPRDETHRRRERHAVKQALAVDPESDVPLRDSKELGKDDWGTVFGVAFMELQDEWDKKMDAKLRRK
jgi:hypothetical protein